MIKINHTIIILLLLIISGCQLDYRDKNREVFFDEKNDTDHVTYFHQDGKKPREVIYYKLNKPDSNIGVLYVGEIQTRPVMIFSPGYKEIYVFYPIRDYDEAWLQLSFSVPTTTLFEDTFMYKKVFDNEVILLDSNIVAKSEEMGCVLHCRNKYDKSIESYPARYLLH